MTDREIEEKIRAAFEKEFTIPDSLYWDEDGGGYLTNSDFETMSQMNHTYIGFSAALATMREEIETWRVSYKEAEAEMIKRQIEINSLKKGMEKMECCGNCSQENPCLEIEPICQF